MRSIATAFALGAMLVSFGASADEETFSALDVDQDGALSMDEVSAAMPATTSEAFSEADTDQNGTLSPEEFSVALQSGTIGVS